MTTKRTATIHGIECVGIRISHIKNPGPICQWCPHSRDQFGTCTRKPPEHFCNSSVELGPSIVWVPRDKMVLYRLQGLL